MTNTSNRLATDGGTPAVAPNSYTRWPVLTAKHDHALLEAAHAAAADLGTNVSAFVKGFEDAYRDYSRARFCVSGANGTMMLRAAFFACGVRPGDEVIVSALGFGLGQAALSAGATPKFVDIDGRTFNMDPRLVPAAITDRTRVIAPADIGGLPAPVQDIRKVSGALSIVQDAAQSAGALVDGRPAGRFADIAVYSGNVQKPLQVIDGGWATTNDEDLAEAMRLVTVFGAPRVRSAQPWETGAHWSSSFGDNTRMYALAAALGIVSLPDLDAHLSNARRLARRFCAALEEIPGFIPPYVPPGVQPTWHLVRILLDLAAFGWDGPLDEGRDRILHALHEEGVRGFGTWMLHPQPQLPVFRREGDHPQAWSPHLRDQPLKPWDPAAFPVATRVLDGSIVGGRCPYPFQVQTDEVIEQITAAFRKVAANIDQVLTQPYQRIVAVPEIPGYELT
jgi:perosamine synthetase